MRPRVLFVAEAVTLAQMVRLRVLAGALPPARYEVHFASARFPDLVFAGTTFARWPIRSLAPETVDRAVSRGGRIYDRETLAAYLEDDMRVLRAVRPALVVGDLRWSLAIAAPLARVPLAALINAYWSPHAARDGFPLPDHPIVRLVGVRLAAQHFQRALPLVFRWFAGPVNDLRRLHRLPPVGDLPALLTHGDHVLHPDIPGLVDTPGAPASHRTLGAVDWAPPVELPPWWPSLDPGAPTAYVTLGSSGRVDLLPLVVQGLAAAGVQCLVATAGRIAPQALRIGRGARIHVAEYLPGDQAAARADLVVSNGGSTTGYQALAAGRPVVGIASNLDQYLAMSAIQRAGAGVLLRAGNLGAADVRRAVTDVLADDRTRATARRLAAVCASHDAAGEFVRFADDVTGRR
jgi:UDP:flavonoid glycosyltransferase YjiC (YdhE family)